MKNKAVFLDRDGIINFPIVENGLPYPPPNLEALHIIDGTKKILKQLKALKYLLLVVTNQPDVARGTIKKIDVEIINKYLSKKLPLDKFFVCYHDNSDNCACRKPLPGMLLEGAKLFDIDLGRSYMVGDRKKDVEAGRRAGCTTIFVDCNYSEPKPENADFSVSSFKEAANIIMEL